MFGLSKQISIFIVATDGNIVGLILLSIAFNFS